MKNWLNGMFKKHSASKNMHDGDFDDEYPMQPDKLTGNNSADELAEEAAYKSSKSPKVKKRWSIRKRVVVFSVIGVVAALLITGGVWAMTIMADPLAQFNNGTSSKPSESQTATTSGQTSAEITPSPTIDPEALLLSMADRSILESKYINIMLIGVDQSEDRTGDDWKGKKDFHSDVMIVLTINRDTYEVSMISLPRDTYAKIPGVDGIYKLNASINCGGGWCEEGFEKVCKAAQWMLGGDGTEEDPIQIDRYFAVDMNAVKELVDSIGGVDYNLDLSFSIQGRSYTKGQQHMNGQAVLDYLRVRKEATGSHEGISEEDAKNAIGDKNRVNRQKMMLVAIFKKIKEKGLLANIPNLIGAFDGNLEYNMTVNEIAALAYFALRYVEPDTIQMYSMGGTYTRVFEPYAFTFTDQSNRIDIIEKVYGVKVKARSYYTMSAAKLRWGKMQAEHFLKFTDSMLDKAKSLLDADSALPEEPTETPPPEVTETPTPPPSESPSPSESVTTEVTKSGMSLTDVSLTEPFAAMTNFKKYGEVEWTLYNKVVGEYEKIKDYDSYHSGDDLLTLVEQYKADLISLCKMLGITVPPETDRDWYYDYVNDYNDIYVDFR